MRSLQKHFDELNLNLTEFKHQPDIVAISETKLGEGNIELDSYDFLRSDSVTCASGVGLYIKKTLKYNLNKCSKFILPNTEHLWVDIHTMQGIVVMSVVYRHPDETTSNIFNE